ncbi:MAG: Holliday junction branch migration protein RuvA [Chloroflexi bacterium]|nr:Holliday junction branch migration protein RuvA [Chloroflexota bacterium]
MIAWLQGTVVRIEPDALILVVAGVGYRVYCGPSTLGAARQGADLALHTHHLVREDVQALYGFRTPEELGFFELLTTVTGVGPRVALAIISSRPVPDLQLAILQADEAVLTAVSGVGRRLAARIVLELKEKVAAAGTLATGSGAGIGAAESEVVGALQALGYAASEAREAGRMAVASLAADASLEDRVKAALRALRRD